MTDQEESFFREVEALESWDRRVCIMGQQSIPSYTELAAYFHEIARRAMTCAFRAEECVRELRTARPALEPD